MQERQKLNVEIEIGQFYIWKETNHLKAKEILLWHTLMHLACTARWVKWISTPISTLESKTGLKRDAIYAARDKLVKLGRIEVLPGKGSKAAQYRIIPFVENYCSEEVEEQLDDPDINTEDTDKQTPTPPNAKPQKEELPQMNIYRKMQTLIMMPSPMDIENIKTYLNDGMEDQLLMEAIDISERELQNKKPSDKWRYAKGIMRNWFNDGIKTLTQYQENEKRREEMMKSGGDKQHNRPVQPEPTPQNKSSGMRGFRIPGETE
ncbi:primosome, DnaD subunit [Alkaliphilus metalliredigens QYMF]|uniref:Primosome, DnaD subunit n=1 Tax=Alkaliphilus metalliredigens (strain QYMF) TaxID=293826 RepID=A6TRD6_ALKMQ|nr:DnaD domain protein [Alkaliphilus metalliredigens]ABR48754.1 primosome, DnaD subunit [Alkaliphilus metalliredigens QYMF]